MNHVLYERTVSAFPLSIGTSLSLESLFEGPNKPYDESREIPQKVNITDYQEFWINIGTLFRNLISAVSRSEHYKLRVRDLAEALIEEMLQIDELVYQQSNQYSKVVFYWCSYKNLEKHLKGITKRVANTEQQKWYEKMLKETLELISRESKHRFMNEVQSFDNSFKSSYPKSLILTHYAVDLLNRSKFSNLDLLESHTGVLKHYNTWYTKYFNGKELMMIPFNYFLIKIFGDNSLISPYHFKIRKLVKEVAVDHQWNWSTTIPKIKNDISKIKDHFSRNSLLALM